jgi:hypothetical protein
LPQELQAAISIAPDNPWDRSVTPMQLRESGDPLFEELRGIVRRLEEGQREDRARIAELEASREQGQKEDRARIAELEASREQDQQKINTLKKVLILPPPPLSSCS